MFSKLYIKKRSEESLRSVYSADLEDSLEKYQLYRRKITMSHV
jgi:hypothetical protein